MRYTLPTCCASAASGAAPKASSPRSSANPALRRFIRSPSRRCSDARYRQSGGSGFRRDVTRRHIGTAAEEMPLHLLGEILPCARIGKAQAILVDKHRLLAQPLRPRFLGYVFEDALAEFARIGREIETFGLAA